MAALTGPRRTKQLTQKDIDRQDAGAPFPCLREAAKELYGRSLAEPANTRLRDAALVLQVVDLALVRRSDVALDVLAAAVLEVEKKEPGIAWGMSASGTWSMRPLPMRRGKGERGPRILKMILREAETGLQNKWPASTIAQLLALRVAAFWPEYLESQEQTKNVIVQTEQLIEKMRAEADARSTRRGLVDHETLVARVLELSGMPSREAWARIKGTRTRGTPPT